MTKSYQRYILCPILSSTITFVGLLGLMNKVKINRSWVIKRLWGDSVVLLLIIFMLIYVIFVNSSISTLYHKHGSYGADLQSSRAISPVFSQLRFRFCSDIKLRSSSGRVKVSSFKRSMSDDSSLSSKRCFCTEMTVVTHCYIFKSKNDLNMSNYAFLYFTLIISDRSSFSFCDRQTWPTKSADDLTFDCSFSRSFLKASTSFWINQKNIFREEIM